MTEIRHFAYISTGKLSAMFTLWSGRETNDPIVNFYVPDHYVCNLASAQDDDGAQDKEALAQTKALDYCARMSDRMGVKVEFRGFYDEPQNLRRGKLSVRDTFSLHEIEDGRFPFGKHRGEDIALAPDSYILYFADKHAETEPVVAALSAACMGVAMERDLIAKRDIHRAERQAADALSAFVGEIGERIEIEGEVLFATFRDNGCGYADQPVGYWISKVRQGNDLLVYFGNKLAEQGERIRFRATVKRHSERQGVKSTVLSRPAKVAVIAA